MLGHDIGMVQELLPQQPACDSASAEDAQHPQGAKKVQGTCQISQQKPNRDQVEKYAEGARDSIMRSSAFAVDVTNRDFNDRRSIPRCQRWNEAVQLAIKRNLFEHLPAIGFEG